MNEYYNKLLEHKGIITLIIIPFAAFLGSLIGQLILFNKQFNKQLTSEWINKMNELIAEYLSIASVAELSKKEDFHNLKHKLNLIKVYVDWFDKEQLELFTRCAQLQNHLVGKDNEFEYGTLVLRIIDQYNTVKKDKTKKVRRAF